MQVEIIVVDNASSDDSVEWLRPRFSHVTFIANTVNSGFAKACNQGMRLSTGDRVLFLNPDTIIPEDCLVGCLRLMDTHREAGAVGIRMIDGSGRFLKESKRSFPSPLTSFYKLSGLARLFPRSRMFSRYHLGHLSEDATNPVEVLSGAFMLIRRDVLEKTDGFDEAFFMYGEDIDLSYRIMQAGYVNYYFAGSHIIHFKGESTRKASANYVKQFYLAMSIFVRKHYGHQKAGLFNVIMHFAIWLRAALAAFARIIRRWALPLIDIGLVLISFFLMKYTWNVLVRTDINYEPRLLLVSFLSISVVYTGIAWYAGLYDAGIRKGAIWKTGLISTVVLLAMYSLLPEQYRFSRAIILLGSLLSILLIAVLRTILTSTGVLESRDDDAGGSIAIIGTAEEYDEVLRLIGVSGKSPAIMGRISVEPEDRAGLIFYKDVYQSPLAPNIRELICCTGAMSYRNFIDLVAAGHGRIPIRVHAAGSYSMVGSDSRNRNGDVLAEGPFLHLSDPYNRRLKRLIDLAIALLLLLLAPVHFIINAHPVAVLRNALLVTVGRLTWIGYSSAKGKPPGLPPLRPGVINAAGRPLSDSNATGLNAETTRLLDEFYARDHHASTDLRLILRSWQQLGN